MKKTFEVANVPVPNHNWSMSAWPLFQVSFIDQRLVTFSFDSIPALDKAITGHGHYKVGIGWKYSKLQWHATSAATWEGTVTSGQKCGFCDFGKLIFYWMLCFFLWWLGDDVWRFQIERCLMIWDWEHKPNGNEHNAGVGRVGQSREGFSGLSDPEGGEFYGLKIRSMAMWQPDIARNKGSGSFSYVYIYIFNYYIHIISESSQLSNSNTISHH